MVFINNRNNILRHTSFESHHQHVSFFWLQNERVTYNLNINIKIKIPFTMVQHNNHYKCTYI